MIEGFKVGTRVEVTDVGQEATGIPAGTLGTVMDDDPTTGSASRVRIDHDDNPWMMYGGEIVHAQQKDAITPDHYKFGNVQVIDIIKYLPFNEGNVIKYVARADRKGNKLEDLRKAQKYLNLAIEIAEEEDD